MTEDQMRAEFEEWYDSHTKNNGGVAYYMDITGKYCFADIQLAWAAWQASRKALCVELPEPCDKYETTDIKRCKKALDKAGVAYK